MNEELRAAYQISSLPSIALGGIMLDGQLMDNAPVNLVLKSLNRHGLIAGATGSGKTKTIQVLCEQLSLAGVPSLVMDIKGDISGLAKPGESTEFLQKRSESLHLPFAVRGFPVEMLTLNTTQPGVPLRATVSDFGPLLFARMLDVNETQSGVVTILFEYAKEKHVPLNDLADVKALLQFAQSDEGRQAIESLFGAIAGSTIGILFRKIIELEAQGGGLFFGEPAFDVRDLLRVTNSGEGIISILRLIDMQEAPKLFSTFMLKLLSDVYRVFPELGDPLKPKLVLFIDEAHLIFNHASKALLNLLETMVKLIRSKGVGLIFCTQSPNDIPDAVLSQLGLKIQHVLRAFTAKDRQALKLVAQNFPPSSDYHTEQLLTSLGIGEALVSALDEKGQPSPLVQCLIRCPLSRMGTLSPAELNEVVLASSLNPKYATRQSPAAANTVLAAQSGAVPSSSNEKPPREKKEESIVMVISKNTLVRQLIRQFFRDITKALLKAFRGR